MFSYESIRGDVQRVLEILFKAYEIEHRALRDWAGSDERLIAYVNNVLRLIAGCVVVIGDNVAISVAKSELDSEDARDMHGESVNCVRFGEALRAGANAFRHYSEWKHGAEPHERTAAVLKRLDVLCDDAACLHILEHFKAENAENFLNALDVLCTSMGQSASGY